MQIVAMLKANPQRLKNIRDSLKFFTLIRRNLYLDRKRKTPKNDEMEPCYCRARNDQPDATNVSYDCEERCLNRMMSTECDDDTCNCFEACANRKFQKHDIASVYPTPQGAKGWGLNAGQPILRGEFIMQYIGEVYNTSSEKGRERVKKYGSSTCTYLMKTSKGEVIDPTFKGNLARFINHSCEPNCITQKWNVLGEICIGIFSLKDIAEDQELTFDYQFDVYATPLTKCLCGTKKCKGYLGLRPTDISADDWNQRLEDMTCAVCDKNYDDDDTKLIICDECNHGFHVYCLQPPLDHVPQDAFYCKACELKKQQLRLRFEREHREKLKETKIRMLEQERLRQEEYQQDSIRTDANYERIYKFLKNQEKKSVKQLFNEEEDANQKEERILATPQKRKEAIIKRTTPSKKRDEFYEVMKMAMDRFTVYLQKHPQVQAQISKSGGQGQGTQNQKKNLLLNRIQMQLIMKSNFALFEKIGTRVYLDMSGRNSADFFLKCIQGSVIGSPQQVALFERIVAVSTDIINKLQVEMGITEAHVSVPAIFLKRLLGPGHSTVALIERTHQVAVYYNRRHINEECYPLETTSRLLLKGGTANIRAAFDEIRRRLDDLEVGRIFLNPYQIKTVLNSVAVLRRKHGLAQFRVAREPPFRDLNHPFFYIQEKNKEVAMIGTRDEVDRTRREIMGFFEEPNRKEEYNFNISLYLAQPAQKIALLGAKGQMEREVPHVKMVLFDPTPPRKNVTVSLLGTREQRLRARELLFRRAEREGKLNVGLDAFQEQMHFQMTKYYFKYMQNALLTRDTAFMKSWDVLNPHYTDALPNYMWKSVRKHLLADYQTLLYACFVLKHKVLQRLLLDARPTSLIDLVGDLLRQNVNRILNVYNVNTTPALKNFFSVLDPDQARLLFRDSYSHISFIRPAQSTTQPRQFSHYEKKVFHKYKGLLALIDQTKTRSRDKEEERKKEKWK